MQIIKNFINLFKARFGAFTDEQFDALCKECDEYDTLDAKKHQNVARVLKMFFAHNVPNSCQLKAIYGNGENLKWLYLKSLSAKRVLTEEEQMYLATKMIFGLVFHFPQPLGDKALTALFERGNEYSMYAYIRDFALPEQFELKLIQLYAKHQTPDVLENKATNPYRFVLNRYLSSSIYARRLLAKVQAELLEKVWDEDLWVTLCSAQGMRENILLDKTIYELILRKYHRALKALLFHSFISSVELQRYLYREMPELKWILEISKVRHILCKMESQTRTPLGVELPNPGENGIIKQYEGTDYKQTFVKSQTSIKLRMQTATPYFCAWAADKYSDFGETAYDCVRKFALKRVQLYRKCHNL